MTKLIVGCGYLGLRVAVLWLAGGHRVLATTRRSSRCQQLAELGIEPILSDVLVPDSLRALPSVSSALYSVGFDRAAGPSMRDVYVRGLANVLEHLPRPERLLYVSSTGVYGQSQGEEVDESAATQPVDESGQVVLEAETLLRGLHAEAVVLRFAGIYGPGRLLRRQAIQSGEPLMGDPEKWLNLIQVEDGAAAVLAAESRARPGGTYNVCDDQPVRRRDFYTLLAQLLGAPPPRFVPPAPDAPASAHERTNRRISNRLLHEELRFSPRFPSFEQGLPASL